ncbi:MAG: class IV adenylate cyclase [Candidatus Paceibacterota bacterium]|jgi:adenylate cyclase class 2
MKTEIETRFLDINKEDLILKLREFGAVDMGEIKLDEVIFYDKEMNSLKENSFTRLRKKGEKITLTYKKNKEQLVDSAREIEFGVSDFFGAKSFLEAIGLIAYRVVEKYRHTFELGGVTLDIDTWPKIPPYVELEGDSVDSLKSVAQKLGLAWESRFDQDARFVFKRYGYDFDNIRTVTFDKFE